MQMYTLYSVLVFTADKLVKKVQYLENNARVYRGMYTCTYVRRHVQV